jgi:hypothetical protein
MFCRSFQITCVNRRQLGVKGEVSLKYEGVVVSVLVSRDGVWE